MHRWRTCSDLRAYWQPLGFYDQAIVGQLAGNLWETFRLPAAKNDHIHDVRAGIAAARSIRTAANSPLGAARAIRPMTGQKISGNRVRDKVGEGGMGGVYKAEDTKLRRIALNRERFLREAAPRR